MDGKQDRPTNHVNVWHFSDEQLSEYQKNIQARMAELAIYNADCDVVWHERYPQQQ